MIILAIETSGASASAAVLGEGVSGVADSPLPRAHAQVLPGLIETAAARAGVAREAVTHVAAARGPGLFTGMRVGLVTADMIGLALDLPVVGVSSLAAAARRVQQRHQPTEQFAVLLDARRREVFAQVFDPAGKPVSEPGTLALDEVGAAAGHGMPAGAGTIWVDPAAAALGFPGHPLEVSGLAAEVAAVAWQRWQEGAGHEPPTPMYLRRPDTSRANPQRSVLGQR